MTVPDKIDKDIEALLPLHTAKTMNSAGVVDLARHAIARLHDQNMRDAPTTIDAARTIGSPVASALAFALIDDTTDTADQIIAELVNAGLSVEAICLDHLAPAARRLGEWWDADRVPFTDVAMATARLQVLLRRMPKSRQTGSDRDANGATFVSIPGEIHTLGVMMAADLFRRHSWDVSLLIDLNHQEIMDVLVDDDRPLIGLSCAGAHSLKALPPLIASIRQQRPDAFIMLGGHIANMPDRLAALPQQPDSIVTDIIAAESEMARVGEVLAARRTG